MNKHYVYACYVNDEIKYIGMGKGSRFKHCQSGKSSCVQLNRDFFNNQKMSTSIIKDGMTRDEALLHESSIIADIGIVNLYNVNGGEVDELLNRSLNLVGELHNKITYNQRIGFNDVKGLIIGLMFKYDNPIQDILNRGKIVKLLNLFGYDYKSGEFFKIKDTDAMQVMSYLRNKMVRA